MLTAKVEGQIITSKTLRGLKMQASRICNKEKHYLDDMLVYNYLPDGDVYFWRRNSLNNGSFKPGKWYNRLN